jgi:hypothetical protein
MQHLVFPIPEKVSGRQIHILRIYYAPNLHYLSVGGIGKATKNKPTKPSIHQIRRVCSASCPNIAKRE